MTSRASSPPIGYTLRVAARLDARWAARFDGFTLTDHGDGTTTLTGGVADQAQLHGLLARIRDLGLVLVSLEASRLPGPPDTPPAREGEAGGRECDGECPAAVR